MKIRNKFSENLFFDTIKNLDEFLDFDRNVINFNQLNTEIILKYNLYPVYYKKQRSVYYS